MLTVDWTQKGGWTKPRIHPHEPLVLDPTASVFHYALECFEGLKAYKDKSGKPRLFRPQDNMARLNRSAARLVLPVRLLQLQVISSETLAQITILTPPIALYADFR